MCTVGDQIKESKLALPFPCRVSGGSHLRALALPPRKVSATVKVARSDGQRFGGFPAACGPSPRASLAIGTEAGIHREVDGRGMSQRLEPRAYRELRNQVLERDGWRCQWCGSLAGVEVHHLVHRSRAGADSAENLIALCAACHRLAHTPRLRGNGNDHC
jgi:HNH endonuclease